MHRSPYVMLTADTNIRVPIQRAAPTHPTGRPHPPFRHTGPWRPQPAGSAHAALSQRPPPRQLGTDAHRERSRPRSAGTAEVRRAELRATQAAPAPHPGGENGLSSAALRAPSQSPIPPLRNTQSPTRALLDPRTPSHHTAPPPSRCSPRSPRPAAVQPPHQTPPLQPP